MLTLHFLLILFILPSLVTFVQSERGSKDLVEKIPGISFEPNYLTYSGYLYANKEQTWKMHYMLTTSRSNKSSDPIVFWFNGGPGCSSFTGAFQEMGPMYVDVDGKSLFENVYSWNRDANMVYLESPIGVGFSYDTTNVKYLKAGDDQTADQNFNAIFDFFNDSHPEYKDRDFYLAGESYAGIYIPTLAAKIAQALSTFSNKNFKGMAIGNGYMHVRLNLNTQILWAYYHGMVGEDEWNTLRQKGCCDRPEGADADTCDWFNAANTTNNLDFSFDTETECGKVLHSILNPDQQIDQYNLYQDCYSQNAADFRSQLGLNEQGRKNPGAYFNRQSTDPNQGYACYNEQTTLAYFNRSDFVDAFHIDKAFYTGGGVFEDCNDELAKTYDQQYMDVTPHFQIILNSLQNFRILILNGDVDMVCNFLGDARFVKQLADLRRMTPTARKIWYFRKRVGGYVQRYIDSSNATIDVLTLKGAGHMTPMDRPGPALQMFSRFLANADSYGLLNEKNPGVPDTLPYKDTGNSAQGLILRCSAVGVAILLLVVGLVRF